MDMEARMQRSARLWISGSALLLLASGLGLVGLTSCTANKPESASPAGTTATPAAMTPEQKIARGHYLVQIGSCTDCHTPGTFYGAPDTTRFLSGSELGWTGPWGTSYPRNLTPDMETGIGKYTEDDIVNVIKKGHKPNGAPILPPMPWPNLANLTDEDAYAIAAYLKSIPAVVHKVPDILPPGKKAPAAIVFPPPPAWDAPKGPPPAAPAAGGK
jgi:mono/diheme cytochrome c family protein